MKEQMAVVSMRFYIDGVVIIVQRGCGSHPEEIFYYVLTPSASLDNPSMR